MNPFHAEQAVRYVDGEMSGDELLAFEQRLAREPEFRALVDNHERLRSTITQAFGAAPDNHDLAGIAARIAGIKVLPLRPPHAARRARFAMFPSRRLASAAAIAASLMIGIFGGWMLHQPVGSAMLSERDQQVAAAGNLEQTLTGRLATETAGGPIRIGLSFASRQGVCRAFSLNSGMDGLACRDGDKWVVHALADRPNARSSTEFRLASSETAPEVLSVVDRMIEGSPFDAVSERRARDARWAGGGDRMH